MRFSVIYSFNSNVKESRKKAFAICVEQTIEFPYHLVKNKYIKNEIVGKIKSIKPVSSNRYLVEITYSEASAGNELTQFLNVVFGNTSINPGIRVESIKLSSKLLNEFKGPRFGVTGIRKLLKIYNRPLICSAIKPMGLSPKELAGLAYKFALGGVDFIKDDHGLANQPFAPFKQRVKLVAATVKKANKITGKTCLYAPNITADGDEEILNRAKFAKKSGVGALVISPGLAGFHAVKKISDDNSINLPILFHPALLGSFTVNKNSGFSHYLLYGQLVRICGADISIFPNYGGRFSFSKEDCKNISLGCRVKMDNIKSIFPGPGGGMTLANVKQMKEFYGNDVVFLMGGGLHAAGPDIIENVRKFRKLISS
jgi:ribulose-bisphosphate carboxylase large chain